MALRESPVRQHRQSRPMWLVVLLIVVGVLVVVGIGYGVISLIRGSSGTDAADESTPLPSPCQTELVPAGDVLPVPADVTVNVYNATGTSGLASKTATALEDSGFKVAKVANDPVGKPITGVAQIRFGPKGREEAELLLVYVPGAQLVTLDRKGKKVDLATGDGFTGLATSDEVTAALASPSPVATGAGCSIDPPASASPSSAP
jgi:hypothetical protein